MNDLFKQIDDDLKNYKGKTNTQPVNVIQQPKMNKVLNPNKNEKQPPIEEEQKESEEEQKESEESNQDSNYVSVQDLKKIKPTEEKTGLRYSQETKDGFKERNAYNLKLSNDSIQSDVKNILLRTFKESNTIEYEVKVSLLPITAYSMYEVNINQYFYFARKYKSKVPLYQIDKDDDFTDDGNFLFFLQNKLNEQRSSIKAYGVYTQKNQNEKVTCNLIVEPDAEGNIKCDTPDDPDSEPCETKACNVTISKIDLSKKGEKDGLEIFSLPDEVFKKPINRGVTQINRYQKSIVISNDYTMLLNTRKTILVNKTNNEAFKIYKVEYKFRYSFSSGSTGVQLYRALNDMANQAKRGGNKEIASYHIRRPAYTTKHKLCRKPIKNRTMRKKRANKRKQ